MGKYRRLVGKIDIIHIKQYLERTGWNTVYFNTPSGDALIEKLNLGSVSEKTDGFVYQAGSLKYVFVNSRLNRQDKLITLIHESAHIFLEHDLSNITKKDEADAWNFTYKVTHGRGAARFFLQFAACIVMALFGAVIATAAITPFDDTCDARFYVTCSGERYHTSDCRYLSGKNCMVISQDALTQYKPCSVCNPK